MNVADGTADTDAATVGQLNSGVTALGSEVVRIIGGSNFSYDGDFFRGMPVNIGGKDYGTVEAALNALYNGTAGSTGGAVGGDEIEIDPGKGAITIAEGGNIQITQDDAGTNKFTVSVSPTPTFTAVYADNASIGGITIGSGGINLGGKKITGLADGNIATGSTDAVTGGQLYSLSESAVKYDDATKNKITLAGTNGSQIANVADGVADTDAVNVGQLNSGVKAGLASLGSGVAGIIGGNGFTYDGEAFSGYAVEIGGEGYYTVEAALNALYNGTAGNTSGAVGGDEIKIDPDKGAITIAEGGNIQITQDGTDTNKFTVSVSQTPTFTAVYADSASIGGISMNSGGINMGGKQITGLAEGNIAMGSTDAVTGGQLYDVKEAIWDSITAINTSITDIDNRVTKTEEAIGATPGGIKNGVQYDDDSKTTITLNEGGEATKITNVADGAITATSTDAVTGRQLYEVNKEITNIDDRVTNTEKNVTNIIDGIATGDIDIITGNSAAVKYDDTDKTRITLNEGGEATQVTNVADGRIAAGSRDAVTGNQLYQAYQRMNDLDKSIDVVGAHAAAMSALHPVPYNKYEPTTFSAGVGTYHDEYAMAIGAFHYIRPNLMVNVGASVCSDGDVMGRIGLSVALGKSTKKQPELAHDVAGMQEQMSVMQAKLIALEEQNRRDKEIIQKNAEIMAQNEKLIRELMQKSANK